MIFINLLKKIAGDIENEKEIEIVALEEESILDAPSEPCGSFIARDDQSGNTSEIVDDKRYSECFKQVIISTFLHT